MAAQIYRTKETRVLDDKFGELLNLDNKVIFYLGKLEYETAGLALLEMAEMARELGFFVGVTRDFLERMAHMTQPTYSHMISYGYISVAGEVNGIEVIIPTEKMLQNKNTLPKYA